LPYDISITKKSLSSNTSHEVLYDALGVILNGMDGERAMGEGHEMARCIVGGGAESVGK
jgi:hypothetical protein